MEKGFTLIETIIVVSLIVVLFAISIFVLKDLEPDFKLSGTARDLATDIRYAQQMTLTEQVQYCVKFLTAEKKYQVVRCQDDYMVLERIIPQDITSFSVSGFLSDEIEFNPYGAVKESGSVSFKNTKDKIKTVEIRPSGFVKIIN